MSDEQLERENEKLSALNSILFDTAKNQEKLIKQYGKYDGEKCTRGFQMWSADFNKILDILNEVSE